jgi:acyl-CoA reductase-like NAD-dependent aldehyde dehydrogenase
VVLKGSDQAPLSSFRFGEFCQEILPPSVVNVLTGDAVTGRAMVRHPDVHRIGIIGSIETGKAVALDAAQDLKQVTL